MINSKNCEEEKNEIESSIIDDDTMESVDKSRFKLVKIAGSIKSEGKKFLTFYILI
jgi:hypothetical protein